MGGDGLGGDGMAALSLQRWDQEERPLQQRHPQGRDCIRDSVGREGYQHPVWPCSRLNAGVESPPPPIHVCGELFTGVSGSRIRVES